MQSRLRHARRNPAGPAMLERLAQLRPAAVDPAANGAQLHAQRVGDLLVGQPLDVAQDHGRAVLRRQRLQRGVDVAVQVPVIEGLGGRRLAPPRRASVSSARPSNLIRCRRRAMSRKRLVVMRCSQPSNVPGV